jgi:hypothetical protein
VGRVCGQKEQAMLVDVDVDDGLGGGGCVDGPPYW